MQLEASRGNNDDPVDCIRLQRYKWESINRGCDNTNNMHVMHVIIKSLAIISNKEIQRGVIEATD